MITVRTQREQAQIKDEILKYRLDNILKDAMITTGIDTWLIPSKEYCENPIFKLLTPANFLTARRLSILILHYDGKKVHKCCCNNPDGSLEEIYENVYTDRSKSQFAALNDYLLSINAKRIAIDVSSNYAYFDGLSKGLYDLLIKELDEKVTSRFESSEKLGISYCEKRSDLEIRYYQEIMDVAISIIEEAFSPEIIKPGFTTTTDVEWFMKQRVKELGLDYWFSPDVNLQNGNNDNPMQTTIINKGDLLHCDFGIDYLSLKTDTQRLAYILKDDEDDIPASIKEGYRKNMEFHQLVRDSFKEGLSGNEIFEAAISKGKEKGLKPMLYTHPLGLFGHAPGPTIGLFSNQGPVFPAGTNILHDKTGYALELNTRYHIPEYGREIFFFTEESVIFQDNKLEYLSAPQGIYKI